MTSQSVAPRSGSLAVFPSAMLRPIPSFVFTVPEGFVVDEAPDALAVLRTPEPVDGAWVTVIIRHDRVARSMDFETAANITFNRLQATVAEAAVTSERLARFGSTVAYLRTVEVAMEKDSRRLAQLHALVFAPTHGPGKVVDMFQIVATTPLELVSAFREPFLEVISTFRFV